MKYYPSLGVFEFNGGEEELAIKSYVWVLITELSDEGRKDFVLRILNNKPPKDVIRWLKRHKKGQYAK